MQGNPMPVPSWVFYCRAELVHMYLSRGRRTYWRLRELFISLYSIASLRAIISS